MTEIANLLGIALQAFMLVLVFSFIWPLLGLGFPGRYGPRMAAFVEKAVPVLYGLMWLMPLVSIAIYIAAFFTRWPFYYGLIPDGLILLWGALIYRLLKPDAKAEAGQNEVDRDDVGQDEVDKNADE